MKKFKNKIAVTGPVSLRKALVEEFLKIGYKLNSFTEEMKDYSRRKYTVNHFDSKNGNLGNTGKMYVNDYQIFSLPKDWDLVLKLAAEVEEEIPEYVECIDDARAKPDLIIGKIYKVTGENGTNKEDFKILQSPFSWRKTRFKPSTKEAYEAQFKPQVGKWYTLEDPTKNIFYVTSVSESGVCYGYGFISGNWFYHTDEKSKSSNCACNEVAFRERAKPATDEEVERALVAEAKKRYPLGCYYQHGNNTAGPFLLNGVEFGKWINYTYPKVGDAIVEKNSTGLIFANGIWAEIVKHTLRIYDYDVQYNPVSTTVKIGCKEFKLGHLISLKNHLQNFNFSIELSIDNYRITKKDLDKIIEFCK